MKSTPVLHRILEPEVMDTASEAEDYNAMDHSAVNRAFVDDFFAALRTVAPVANRPWRIFDAGTGTALIPLELVGRNVPVEITAADLAEEMLAVARRNIAAALPNAETQTPNAAKIELIRADCKALSFADGSFDAVISNSIVHHIPEPIRVLRECWRILRLGGLLFVRDLMRPADLAELDRLVETHAASANAHGRQMFRDSLHAALTVEEIGKLLDEIGISADVVSQTSDRHWTLATVKI
jgi:SAM-dependent methyltransferase